jgi:zinc-finger of transposase IS204/IS1001/IS1096/IS1165
MDCLDTTTPFFPLPDGLVIASLVATETQLVVQVACRLPTACCPLCQQPSERIHGHDGPTVADLPCAGQRVILALSVRKFVCRTPTCPQRIITLRLPELVQSYARITNRLREAALRSRPGSQCRGLCPAGPQTRPAGQRPHPASLSAHRLLCFPRVGAHAGH